MICNKRTTVESANLIAPKQDGVKAKNGNPPTYKAIHGNRFEHGTNNWEEANMVACTAQMMAEGNLLKKWST